MLHTQRHHRSGETHERSVTSPFHHHPGRQPVVSGGSGVDGGQARICRRPAKQQRRGDRYAGDSAGGGTQDSIHSPHANHRPRPSVAWRRGATTGRGEWCTTGSAMPATCIVRWCFITALSVLGYGSAGVAPPADHRQLQPPDGVAAHTHCGVRVSPSLPAAREQGIDGSHHRRARPKLCSTGVDHRVDRPHDDRYRTNEQ